MSLQVGKTYWFAIHSKSASSGTTWSKGMQGQPFQVKLLSQTKACLSWQIEKTGERFLQSTWPLKQLGVYRPPFVNKEDAQSFCDNQMVKFDVDGGALNKLSKSQLSS